MVNGQKEKDTIRLERIAKAGPEIVEKVAKVHRVGISCAKVAMKSKWMKRCIFELECLIELTDFF